VYQNLSYICLVKVPEAATSASRTRYNNDMSKQQLNILTMKDFAALLTIILLSSCGSYVRL
jgi:hypothetical protein